jgi:hypothetical protein
MTEEKSLNFEWYTPINWKIGIKNHDKKYLRHQNLMKFFLWAKNKVKIFIGLSLSTKKKKPWLQKNFFFYPK